jgi:hypothetical protein
VGGRRSSTSPDANGGARLANASSSDDSSGCSCRLPAENAARGSRSLLLLALGAGLGRLRAGRRKRRAPNA